MIANSLTFKAYFYQRLHSNSVMSVLLTQFVRFTTSQQFLADLEKHVGAQSKDSDSIFYGDILRTIWADAINVFVMFSPHPVLCQCNVSVLEHTLDGHRDHKMLQSLRVPQLLPACTLVERWTTSLSDTVVSNTSLIAGVKKMTAKAAKTVKYGSNVDGISTAEPEQYAKRFIAFMGDAIEWSSLYIHSTNLYRICFALWLDASNSFVVAFSLLLITIVTCWLCCVFMI